MSLLLDDDEVFAPPTKSVKVEVQVLDCDDEGNAHCARQPAEMRSKSSLAVPDDAGAAAAAAVAVAFSKRGGNGMEKMDALTFGMPRVAVLNGGGTPSRARNSAAVSVDNALPAAHRTPLAQKTFQPASQLNSDVRSTFSTATEPKIVSAVQSPSSSSLSPSMTERHISVASADNEVLLPSQGSVIDTTSTATTPRKPNDSPSASPPARPPVKPSQTSAAPEATAAQPARTQMKLSDFFSKMACKR